MTIKGISAATISAVIVAGLATWSLEPGQAQDNNPAPVQSRDKIDMMFGPPSSYTKAIMARVERASFKNTTSDPGDAAAGAAGPEASPLEGLSIVKQSIRRGGLGSRAMAVLELRNANDYPVRDVGVRCEFKSRDGMISTQRVRTIERTMKPRSREALPPTLIGHITVMASDGKCSLVSANRAWSTM